MFKLNGKKLKKYLSLRKKVGRIDSKIPETLRVEKKCIAFRGVNEDDFSPIDQTTFILFFDTESNVKLSKLSLNEKKPLFKNNLL
jgi:hypothetical protein